MSKIIFSETAWEEYLELLSEDRKTLKRVNQILKDIQRNAFDGIGKPEPLKGSCNWSRRIDEMNRLVYEIVGGDVVVKQCKGHYDDK